MYVYVCVCVVCVYVWVSVCVCVCVVCSLSYPVCKAPWAYYIVIYACPTLPHFPIICDVEKCGTIFEGGRRKLLSI